MLLLMSSTFAYADNAIESAADKSQAISAEQYAENQDTQPSDDTIKAVCQANPDYPCCCRNGGSRSCMTESACDNLGGKCVTKDHYGNCP